MKYEGNQDIFFRAMLPTKLNPKKNKIGCFPNHLAYLASFHLLMIVDLISRGRLPALHRLCTKERRQARAGHHVRNFLIILGLCLGLSVSVNVLGARDIALLEGWHHVH